MLDVAFCLALALVGTTHRAPTVTVASLLSEMTDRDTLARLPEPPYKQLQASSYDRKETDPNDPKTWFANQDYGQFIRTEQHHGRTEWVVMEHAGPGAVTRIWTPLLKDKDKMLVRFYFDGADKPGIEEDFNDLMRGRGKISAPFATIAWPDPAITDGVGSDLYFPIPFAKSCKITFSEVPFYYSIDYRAYPAGVRVQTFTWEAMGAASAKIDAAAADLPYAEPDDATPMDSKEATLATGEACSIDLPTGAHAVSEIELDAPLGVSRQTLRSLVMRLDFDGEPTGWCPIGDFFGCGVTLKPVTDRFRHVSGDGKLRCVWPMPYAKSGAVSVVNVGSALVHVTLHVRTKAWKWDARSMHFHATWRHQYPLATRPMSDWNYLQATGQGVYVGDTLTVWNPSPAWYGEGDERVYVDGEKFPSQLGTGTEDYYGYAWGMAEHWSSAFMAMPERDRKGRDNWLGFTTTSRVRGLDAIPFTRDFRFDMEIWHWADCQEEYSAATFWYARPGATCNRTPMPADASADLPVLNNTIPGAIECEQMSVLAKSPDVDVSTQTGGLKQGSWSDGEQLFLQAHKKGDFVELAVPNQLTGKHRILVYATKSYDYGIVRFVVNGWGSIETDLYNADPIASGPIDVGEFDLGGKDVTLRVEVVDTNRASTGNHYYFGLDCVVIK